MKKGILTSLFALFLVVFTSAQSFVQITDESGVKLTAEELSSVEAAAQQAIDILPVADRPLFKVYDVGFYIHYPVTNEGISPVWEQIQADVENLSSSEYYLIFGRESSSTGLNKKIRVKLKLPQTSAYGCLTEEERSNLEKNIEQAANDSLDIKYIRGELVALKFLKDYLYKIIVCNCSNVGANCTQFNNFSFLDIQLRGLGFRKKEIELGGASSWSSGTQEIYDYAGKNVIIDGTEYDIADQVSEGKALIEASVQVLPDTTISTSISGKVYILDNESFINGEWEAAKAEAASNDYVEYWVILINNSGKSFLYSKFTIGKIAPVSAKSNDDQNQERSLSAISPVQAGIKLLGNAAVDAFFQAIIAYKFDPSVNNFYPDALGKVSYLGAAWEGLSSLIPWKKYTQGSDITAIALQAASGALVVVLDKSINDPSYSWEQAWDDFMVGFGASVLTQLVFHPKVVAITGQGSRYARLAFAKGLRKLCINHTNLVKTVANKSLNTLSGTVTKRLLSSQTDATLISRVKQLRSKMSANYKTKGNFALAKVNISGISKNEFFAHSKIHDLSNPTIAANMPEISIKPVNKIFPSEEVENSAGQLFDRDVDSEYKILTEIADLLGENLNASGTIKLFTERDVCRGCANVIQMFSNIYKSINIEIIHNNGGMLLP